MNSSDNLIGKGMLTIMVGFPRAGKSKWVAENCGDAVVVGGDQFRDLLFNGSYAKEGNMVVLSLIESTVRLLLSQNKNVILDGIHLTKFDRAWYINCLLYTSPSPRDGLLSRMPSSA